MIVRMKHLDLVCTAASRKETIECLRSLGLVHIDLAAASGAKVQVAVGQIGDAERALRLVRKARGDRLFENLTERSVSDVLSYEADRANLVAEKERLEREIKFFEPYGDFDPDLARKLTGRGIDLAEVLPSRLPEMRLSKLREKLARVDAAIARVTDKIAQVDDRAILALDPALRERMEFEQAMELLADRGEVSVVSGWVPVSAVEALLSAARSSGWGVLLREPAEGENPPTLVDPPRFVRPVKALFEGLGIAPAYYEADVSVPFMCYFTLFFAMLVGDGAYGAILLALTLWGWKKLGKASRGTDAKAVMTRSWLVLMTVFSLATIAWGVVSNTWFGAGIPWCADWPTVRWLSGAGAPAGHEYDNMMFLCFTIGVSHLMLARIWNGVCKLNDRSCLGEFGWAGMVLFMYVLTNSIVGIFPGIPTWCYWMFGVSFLTVFVQAKGMDKGMLFLNAMSVLGDIISYVRLFAVGLASVKVAQNFNAMAVNLDLPLWLKGLPLVLIMLVGHGLNFVMAGLSVLVHAVRLNTLEFSNHKGISWAGYAFRPFKKIKE